MARPGRTGSARGSGGRVRAFVGGSDGGGRKQEATRAFQASDDRAKQGLIPLNKRSPAPVRHLTWLHLAIDQMSRISRAAVGPCLAVWLLGTPARPSRTPHDLPERVCLPPRRLRPSCSASTRTLGRPSAQETRRVSSHLRRAGPPRTRFPMSISGRLPLDGPALVTALVRAHRFGPRSAVSQPLYPWPRVGREQALSETGRAARHVQIFCLERARGYGLSPSGYRSRRSHIITSRLGTPCPDRMDQAPRRPPAQNTNQRDPQHFQVPNFHPSKCCAPHLPIYATTVRRAGKHNEI